MVVSGYAWRFLRDTGCRSVFIWIRPPGLRPRVMAAFMLFRAIKSRHILNLRWLNWGLDLFLPIPLKPEGEENESTVYSRTAWLRNFGLIGSNPPKRQPFISMKYLFPGMPNGSYHIFHPTAGEIPCTPIFTNDSLQERPASRVRSARAIIQLWQTRETRGLSMSLPITNHGRS